MEIPKNTEELQRLGTTTTLTGSPTPEKEEELVTRNSADNPPKDPRDDTSRFPEYSPAAAERAVGINPDTKKPLDSELDPKSDNYQWQGLGREFPTIAQLTQRGEQPNLAQDPSQPRSTATEGPMPIPQPKSLKQTQTVPAGVRADYFGNRGNMRDYFYRVRANFPFGSSDWSAPAVVRGQQGLNRDSKVLISWNVVPGAVSYDGVMVEAEDSEVSGRICVFQGETATHFTDEGIKFANIPERTQLVQV